MELKRAAACTAIVLRCDPLKLYDLPFRELVEWCEVANNLSRKG
jgi:hypothetical protein